MSEHANTAIVCTHQRVRARVPYNGLGDCLDCGGLTWIWLSDAADDSGSHPPPKNDDSIDDDVADVDNL